MAEATFKDSIQTPLHHKRAEVVSLVAPGVRYMTGEVLEANGGLLMN